MTDNRPRRLPGLPEHPSVRRALMKRLIWGAVLAVPAAGLFALIVVLGASYLSYNPSWWEWQTPATFLRSAAGWFGLGIPVGGAAASGAAVALLVYTARGGSQNRPVIAGIGALLGSILVGFVIDVAQHGYPVWTVIFGVPGGIIGGGIAAGYVAWAVAAARRRASS